MWVVTSDWMSAWPKGSPNVKVTWCSTALGHQMPLLGVGLKPLKWNGTYAAVLLASHSTPSPCFRTLCLNLPITNQEKTLITQRVLVTQSSNILHCNWHTQKSMCADFQAFSNTFSLFKLMGFFFIFCLGEFSKQPKISHFVDFDWKKCIEMAWVAHI